MPDIDIEDEMEDTPDFDAIIAKGTTATAEPAKKKGGRPKKAEVIIPSDEPSHDEPEKIAGCGLPESLALNKKALVEYVNEHGYDNKDRGDLRISQYERDAYELYRQGKQPVPAPRDFFIVALRLWKHNFPIKAAGKRPINEMIVQD